MCGRAVVDDLFFLLWCSKTVFQRLTPDVHQEMSQITTITSKTTNVHGEEMIVTTGAFGVGWVGWEGWVEYKHIYNYTNIYLVKLYRPQWRSPEMVV